MSSPIPDDERAIPAELAEEQTRLPTTYDAAMTSAYSAYDLARLWVAVSTTPVRVPAQRAVTAGIQVRTTEHDLAELATMRALRTWLDQWTGLQIHQLLDDGADVETVVAAAGMNREECACAWREWAAGQRDLYDRDTTHRLGLSAEDHERVARTLHAVNDTDGW